MNHSHLHDGLHVFIIIVVLTIAPSPCGPVAAAANADALLFKTPPSNAAPSYRGRKGLRATRNEIKSRM